jgi:hypothetical protein
LNDIKQIAFDSEVINILKKKKEQEEVEEEEEEIIISMNEPFKPL